MLVIFAFGDVELNPGPARCESSKLHFGCINVCSDEQKRAPMRDVIVDLNLDFLITSETEVTADMKYQA
jgi:hypothetical protein